MPAHLIIFFQSRTLSNLLTDPGFAEAFIIEACPGAPTGTQCRAGIDPLSQQITTVTLP